MACSAEPFGEAPGSVWEQREGGEIIDKSLSCVFCRNRLGRKPGLGLASLNDFSRFWGTEAVPSCPECSPRVIRVGIVAQSIRVL